MNPHGLVVPAYFHPATSGTDWSRLVDSASLLRAVILNIDSGPGVAPEPALLAAARGLVGRVTVLGYVDTDYAARPAAAVLADVTRYLAWYGVDGVFLDQVSSGAGDLPWYRRVIRLAREAGAGEVVVNPGVVPEHRGYAEIVDGLVSFEGPYSSHRRLRVPPWLRELPRERFWHLVYATPRRLLGPALRCGESQHAGVVAVTDGDGANPWGRLPTYFAECGAGRLLGRRFAAGSAPVSR